MIPLTLPMAGLHDCSARLAGQPRFPRTRGDCESGERPCPHVTCRHHLLGDIARMTDRDAERAMVNRLEQGVTETCCLDAVSDGALSDAQIAVLTGISPQRVAQVAAEATHRLKLAIRGEGRSHGVRQKREPWTDERRRRAVELHHEGLTIRAIADRIGASPARVIEAIRGEPLFTREKENQE